jgi:hypothetical protein
MGEKNTKSGTKNENNNSGLEKLDSVSKYSNKLNACVIDVVKTYEKIIGEIKSLLKFMYDFRHFIILLPDQNYLERRAKWNLNFAQTTIDSITKVITKMDDSFNHTGVQQQENARFTPELKAKFNDIFNDIKHSLECVKRIGEEVSNEAKCDIINSDRLFERCHDLLYFFQKIETLLDCMMDINDVKLLKDIMGPVHAAQRYLDMRRPILKLDKAGVTLISDKNNQFFSFRGYDWGLTHTDPYFSKYR